LKQPTRPETPSDLGRQLFTKESEFAQHRPPSAYGVPSSKQFFDSGPKLSIAKLDGFARAADCASTGLALAGSRRSILENGPASTAADSPSYRGSAKSTLHQEPRSGRSPAGQQASYETDFSFAGPGGRPTAAATVAAIKASMAVGSKAYLRPDEEEATGPTLDPRRNDDLPPRPNTSRGRPGSGLGEGMSTSSRPTPLPTTVDTNGAQVLDMSQLGHYSDTESDSGDEDDSTYRGMYRYERDGVGNTSMAREIEGSTAHGSAVQEGVVHDPSEAFYAWRNEVEGVLQQLAAATAALAAAQQAAVAAGGPGPAVREAMQTLTRHCDGLVKLVEAMRKQPNSSKWLNSSSASYSDGEGRPLTMREAISEHVFRLMDSSSTELIIKATAVVLRVVKSRTPLLQAGKLLYRLSKDSANDMLFKREGLLEPMLRTVHIMVASTATTAAASSATAVPATTSNLHEPLVYYCGALKNCSNDASNQRALVKAGALHVLCSALSTMAAQVQQPETQASEEGRTSNSGDAGAGASLAASGTSSMGAAQVAVQITGVLRNLAVAPPHAPSFVSAGALPALRAAAGVLPGQQELVLNIGRVLSKLSLSEACLGALEGDTAFCSLLVSLLRRHARHRPLMLRLAFVLGNLTTHHNAYRQQVASVPGALDMLVSTLQLYASPAGEGTDPERPSPSGRPGTSAGSKSAQQDRLARAASREDCAVKLLRLIANLAIHPEVGMQLASTDKLAGALLTVLETTSFGGGGEELVLNAVCAVTNLSFYQRADNQVLALGAPKLLRHVTPLLLCDNEEAVVEAARAFGNFSRTADARTYMVGARVLEALVLLLDHSSTEVLYSVCGTLINFSADLAHKQELVSLAAPGRLVDVLERCLACEEPGEMEVGTLSVVCKALFNLCADEPGGKSGSAGGGAEGTAGASGLSGEQLEALATVLQGVQECEELMAHAEVPQVTTRLLSVVQRIISH